jgi:hypothetical protein
VLGLELGMIQIKKQLPIIIFVRRAQIDTINSLGKLARSASKAQLWWLKHKNPSLDAEYYSHYVNY